MEELKNQGMVPLNDDELEEAAGGGILTDALKAMLDNVVDYSKNLLHIQTNGDEPITGDGLVYYKNREDALKASALPYLGSPEEIQGQHLTEQSIRHKTYKL